MTPKKYSIIRLKYPLGLFELDFVIFPHDDLNEIILIETKFDWLNDYTHYIKFGIGRSAPLNLTKILKKSNISREEGIALMKKYEDEYPR